MKVLTGLVLCVCFVAVGVSAKEQKATFAGGCFWCMEPPFDKLDGVISTISGFSGGVKENPTYKEVTRGGTGHAEVVQVTYDDEKITYQELLDVFWVNIDPLDDGGQFCDRGSSYRTAIFYHNEEQKKLATASKKAIADSGRFEFPIATEINAFKTFYPAGEEHQNYYLEHPVRYKLYRTSCGRDGTLEDRWGDMEKLRIDK
jgi:peptide-methionine (S)-S-oxide reductase